MTKEWIDHRSDKRKVVRLDIIDSSGDVVAEVDHNFDPKNGAAIAGAVMEIINELPEGYKLKRTDTTSGKVRESFIARIVKSGIRSAC